jgi:hypothetical protein
MIHLHTLVGGRLTTLRPMLEHYRTLGVQSFLIHVHLTAPSDPFLDEVRAVTSEFGVPIASVVVGKWQELIVRVYAQSRNRYPNDWHILADQDEFHCYPCDLSELEEMCDKNEYDCVSGCWIDRIAADGGFPEIEQNRSVWEQFPIGAFLSYPIGAADPRKVVLTRSGVNLVKGQHFATNGRSCPITKAFVQVHHFKWLAGIVSNLEARAALLKADGYTQHVESFRFLRHIKNHGDRINLDDPRILRAECARNYPHWPLIQRWFILLSQYVGVGQQIIPGPSALWSNLDGIAQRADMLRANIRAGQDECLYSNEDQANFGGFEPLRVIWFGKPF